MKKDITTVVDVNVNRAREGLRVIEESLRHVYKDEFFKKFRTMRHEVSRLFNDNSAELLCARRSNTDIGKASVQVEYRSLNDLVAANFKRVQESLRVLEEYSRLAFMDKLSAIKAMRFGIYSLEKKYYEKNTAKRPALLH